jgi:hypothetical protein
MRFLQAQACRFGTQTMLNIDLARTNAKASSGQDNGPLAAISRLARSGQGRVSGPRGPRANWISLPYPFRGNAVASKQVVHQTGISSDSPTLHGLSFNNLLPGHYPKFVLSTRYTRNELDFVLRLADGSGILGEIGV